MASQRSKESKESRKENENDGAYSNRMVVQMLQNLEEDAIQAHKKQEEEKVKPEFEQFRSALSINKLIDTAMSNVMLKQSTVGVS